VVQRVLAVTALLGLLAALALLVPSSGPMAQTAGVEDGPRISLGETEAAGPGVRHTEFTWSETEGTTEGDLLEVSLRNPSVSVDLIHPGAVAARDEASDGTDAVAAVNGDFFNIGETNAPVGPVIAHRQDRTRRRLKPWIMSPHRGRP